MEGTLLSRSVEVIRKLRELNVLGRDEIVNYSSHNRENSTKRITNLTIMFREGRKSNHSDIKTTIQALVDEFGKDVVIKMLYNDRAVKETSDDCYVDTLVCLIETDE